jgi:hypothetical protein
MDQVHGLVGQQVHGRCGLGSYPFGVVLIQAHRFRSNSLKRKGARPDGAHVVLGLAEASQNDTPRVRAHRDGSRSGRR